MSVQKTRSQKLAQAAFPRVQARYEGQAKLNERDGKEYTTFAKKFPALVHTCGLAQAVAFALAKEHTDYLEDLACVLHAGEHPEIHSAEDLHAQTRNLTLSAYLRLSGDALQAASWLKRYVEAFGGGQ